MKIEITIESPKTARDPIVRVMEVFYEVNPMLNWGNKTFRKACVDMNKVFGVDHVVDMARQILGNQGKKYFPVVTNPYQMKEKLLQCKIYFEKNKPMEENNSTDIYIS